MSQVRTNIRADKEIATLLEQLCPAFDTANADETLARVVWSRITEPGDSVAGKLVQSLQPAPALELVCAGVSAQELQKVLDPTIAPGTRTISQALERWRARISRAETVHDLRRAIKNKLRLINPEQTQLWPEQLQALEYSAPYLLWVRGNPALISSHALAVVGARAATPYGANVTAEFVSTVCAAGYSIISGAAYGIDAVAHRTALACDSPTVAVLAGGADRAYPAAHDTLLHAIAAAGAVCSEMPPGAQPTRWRFLQRNRLIAALASAVLVIEAGHRSGTINTAGHAAEMGRPLGAVPGPITSAMSSGCHRLIREYGATLVTTGSEALELLGENSFLNGLALSDATAQTPAPSAQETATSKRGATLHLRILDALPLRGKRNTAQIASVSGVTLSEATNALVELEVLGYVAKKQTPTQNGAEWVLIRRE